MEDSENVFYLSAFNNTFSSNLLRIFTKLIYNGIYYCSNEKETKRCDSIIITKNGESGLIEIFFQVDGGTIFMFM